MGTSTFSNFTVLPEIALAKVNKAAPFDKICYIGCGVTTGIGAVINTAKAETGCTAIVFGLGGIGLNVIQGLRLIGASQIVGVDLNNDKRRWGERFGMTDFVNPAEVSGDLTAHLIEVTGGGADYTFECIGNTDVMRVALNPRIRAGANRLLLVSPGRGAKFPPARFSWSPAGPGAGPRLAAHGAAQMCRKLWTGIWMAGLKLTR